MKLTLLPIVFCLFALAIFGQKANTEKFDEFEEFDYETSKVRTYNFAEELRKTPESKGYVIVYEGKYKRYKQNSQEFDYVLPRVNELNWRIKLIKTWFSFLNYPPENIVFIKGGIREKLTVEYFIVLKDSEIPKLTPTLNKIKHRKGKIPKITGNLAEC